MHRVVVCIKMTEINDLIVLLMANGVSEDLGSCALVCKNPSRTCGYGEVEKFY
jgi:hypothetical protein